MSTSFAYLSNSDRERLGQLPFPVALPHSLPQGWSMQPWQLFQSEEDEETSLEVPFQGPNSATWSILTSDGGFGDVLPGETEHSQRLLDHEVFGSILVHSFVEDDTPEVVSDWFPEDEEATFFHAFRGSSLEASELQALLESLDLFGEP